MFFFSALQCFPSPCFSEEAENTAIMTQLTVHRVHRGAFLLDLAKIILTMNSVNPTNLYLFLFQCFNEKSYMGLKDHLLPALS